MATVYSLIAWGGRTGKTVSLSASTDVVTLTNHGLRDGTKLWPSGTLPAELNTSTPVYARSTADNTFTLHTSSAGAIANTGQITFAGSSTYAAVVLKSDLVANAASALAPYGLSDLSRWGSSGSERIYDGLTNWRSVRNGATTAYDTEIAELGEAFVETITSEITLNMACAETKITSLVNGVRSSAFHAGYVGSLLTTSGYCLFASGAINGLNASGGNITIDGFAEHIYNSGSFGVTVSGYNTEVKNMLIRGGSGGSMCAIQLIQPAVMSKIHHNIILETGWVALYSGGGQGAGSVIYNNLIHDCYVGFYGEGSLNRGTYYNNIAVGNGTNWHSSSPSNMVAAYNFGESTGNTPWNTGATTYVNTMVSGDFVDYANHDFTTSSASAHQVDAAIAVPLAAAFDLLGNEVPNYNNGAAEYWDGGPIEFNHGYIRPASHELTLTNVVVGSRVFIRDQADTTTHHDDIAASSTVVVTVTVYGDTKDNWRIRIRKASASPYYQPYETLMTATAGESSIYVSQIPDEPL